MALRSLFDLGDGAYGFTVASALIGTIVGAITFSKPSDKFGRKKTLLITAVLYFVSAVGSAFAWNWYSFLIFRFIGGLGVGGATVVSPTYIAEISPAKFRGRLVALTQFNIVFGILLAFLSNYIITVVFTNTGAGIVEGTAWRWMFGVEAFPALIFFLMLFANPLSPRWLMGQKRPDEAKAVLTTLGTENVDEEMASIQTSLDLEHHSIREPLYCKKYIKPIMLAVLIAMFNQLSGINAILYYAPAIFRMAGAGEESAMFQPVLIGFTNLIFTMAALLIIDHFGRKKLMLVGSIGYIVSLGVAAWTFFTYSAEFAAVSDSLEAIAGAVKAGATPQVVEALRTASAKAISAVGSGGMIVLISIVVFVASHAFGQGAVIWVFISEIFPNRVRARGQALGSFTHWIMAAAVSGTFPLIAKQIGGGTVFAFYCVMMVFQLIWVIAIMPETKGVPLEQIQKHLGIE